jgi:hypothetical protein
MYNLIMELDIQKILTEIEKDVSLDELNLRESQFRLPAIKHKYAGILIRAKIQMVVLQKNYETTKRDNAKKIKEGSPVKLSSNAIDDVADDLPSVKKIKEEMANLKLLIELLEKTEKTLSSMTYDIKNIIEIQKLETT